MRVLVVVAHPLQESFTHALAGRFCAGLEAAGHESEWLDLYTQDFQPVASPAEYLGWREQRVPEDVEAQQARLRRCQGLALVFPVWWGAPPALLQGWLQRTLTAGFGFEYGPRGPRGLLEHRGQLIVNIGGTDPDGQAHYIEPIAASLRFCGIAECRAQLNQGVNPGMTAEQAAAALQQAYEAGRAF